MCVLWLLAALLLPDEFTHVRSVLHVTHGSSHTSPDWTEQHQLAMAFFSRFTSAFHVSFLYFEWDCVIFACLCCSITQYHVHKCFKKRSRFENDGLVPIVQLISGRFRAWLARDWLRASMRSQKQSHPSYCWRHMQIFLVVLVFQMTECSDGAMLKKKDKTFIKNKSEYEKYH